MNFIAKYSPILGLVAVVGCLKEYQRKIAAMKQLDYLTIEKEDIKFEISELQNKWNSIPNQLTVDRNGMVDINHFQSVVKRNINNQISEEENSDRIIMY